MMLQLKRYLLHVVLVPVLLFHPWEVHRHEKENSPETRLNEIIRHEIGEIDLIVKKFGDSSHKHEDSYEEHDEQQWDELHETDEILSV